MSSEKLRYKKKIPERRGMSWSWNQLPAILQKLPVDSLVTILMQGAESSSPLRRSLLIYAAYAAFDGNSSETLEATVREAMDLTDENINWSDSDSYAQVANAAESVVKSLIEAGTRTLALRIADIAIEMGEQGAEQLQDGDSWEMAISDLVELRKSLA